MDERKTCRKNGRMKHCRIWFVSFLAIVTGGACQEHSGLDRHGDHRGSEGVVARSAARTWLREAKYGVCVCFLGEGPSWNEQVNRFDVKVFADQMSQAGVGYVLLTLGQNSGYYCAPNATYDRYTGYEPGERCSRRDLPMELADALASHGIRLLLYCTSRAPQNDAKARTGLAEIDDIISAPAPQEFTRRWSDVIREWSERYGTKLAGWWFDGAYTTGGWDDLSRPYNWHTWAAAARAGNPGRLLAFNKGTRVEDAFGLLTREQDYTAGERNAFDLLPKDAPCPPDLQWHLFCYLGKDWGQPGGPLKSDAWMVDYVRRVNEQGGVVTFDVHIIDGSVYEPHLRQLRAIREGIRRGNTGM
jgi:hypothetical protein